MICCKSFNLNRETTDGLLEGYPTTDHLLNHGSEGNQNTAAAACLTRSEIENDIVTDKVTAAHQLLDAAATVENAQVNNGTLASTNSSSQAEVAPFSLDDFRPVDPEAEQAQVMGPSNEELKASAISCEYTGSLETCSQV